MFFPDPVVSYPVSAGFNSFTDIPPTPAPAPERVKVMVTSLMTMIIIIIICQVLLHADDEYEYYKVAVSNGTRMTEGKVSVHFKSYKKGKEMIFLKNIKGVRDLRGCGHEGCLQRPRLM